MQITNIREDREKTVIDRNTWKIKSGLIVYDFIWT